VSSEEGLTERRHPYPDLVGDTGRAPFLFILILPATHARRADLEIGFEIITDWTVVQFQRKIERGKNIA
jgi:hypothetical protein